MRGLPRQLDPELLHHWSLARMGTMQARCADPPKGGALRIPIVALSLSACSPTAQNTGSDFGPGAPPQDPPGSTDAGSGDGGATTDGDDGGSTGATSTGSGHAVCNDGVRDDPEECDTNDVGGMTCQDLGFEDGMLQCNVKCELDTTMCRACGDGTAQPPEECDGVDLAGKSCMTEGFSGGTLACSAMCTLDTAGCMACQPNYAPCTVNTDCCSGYCYTYGGYCEY